MSALLSNIGLSADFVQMVVYFLTNKGMSEEATVLYLEIEFSNTGTSKSIQLPKNQLCGSCASQYFMTSVHRHGWLSLVVFFQR